MLIKSMCRKPQVCIHFNSEGIRQCAIPSRIALASENLLKLMRSSIIKKYSRVKAMQNFRSDKNMDDKGFKCVKGLFSDNLDNLFII